MDEIRIREFKASDGAAVARIHNSLFPNDPYFSKRAEYEDSCYGRTRYRMKRLVAERVADQVVGFGEYKHFFFSYHPRKFALEIEVHPQWQRQGVGGMLHDRIMEKLSQVKVDTVWAEVLSTSASGIRFITKRGFFERSRTIELRLDLRNPDLAKVIKETKSSWIEGMTITNLSSEMRRDSSAGRKFKDLEDSGAQDIPHTIADYLMDFHDYKIVVLNSPVMVWEGSFVAKRGTLYVGSSSLLESGMDNVIDQGFTVVRPEYRGSGIAQAVKLLTALYARNKGFRYIRTRNDSENNGMLAVNRKMGFVKQTETITFEKHL